MIGLLLCDLPAAPVLETYGDYRSIFSNTLKTKLVPFKVYEGELPENVSEYTSFVISGSSASAYESKEWILKFLEFLRYIHESTDIKIVGICFGFQVLSLALGGQVEKNNLGWEVGPTLLKCNSKGLNYTKIQQFKIQSMHQDIVSKLPKDWVILASSDKCEAQFAVYKDRYLCLQGHPEFTRDMVEKIVSERKSLWSNEFTSEILKNLEKDIDASVILGWIMEFLEISSKSLPLTN